MKRTDPTEIRYAERYADKAAMDLYKSLLAVVSNVEEVLEYSSEIPGGYRLSEEDRAMVAKAVGLLFDLNMVCGS
jgi:hypothetical protein